MGGSLVIIAKRFLVARNIHIIRLVLNSVSAEAVGVIQLVLVYFCFSWCLQGCQHSSRGCPVGLSLSGGCQTNPTEFGVSPKTPRPGCAVQLWSLSQLQWETLPKAGGVWLSLIPQGVHRVGLTNADFQGNNGQMCGVQTCPSRD